MNVLITGIAGCGKSTVSQELQKLGYTSFDFEDIEGMFAMYDKDTKKLAKNYNNEDLESVKQNQWICNIGKLKNLMKNNLGLTFYCGKGDNLDDLIPLFDLKLLLVTDEKTTSKRLKKRKEAWEYAHTTEVQQYVLKEKKDWEKGMIEKGFIKIDANKPIKEVIKSILFECN